MDDVSTEIQQTQSELHIAVQEEKVAS